MTESVKNVMGGAAMLEGLYVCKTCGTIADLGGRIKWKPEKVPASCGKNSHAWVDIHKATTARAKAGLDKYQKLLENLELDQKRLATAKP